MVSSEIFLNYNFVTFATAIILSAFLGLNKKISKGVKARFYILIALLIAESLSTTYDLGVAEIDGVVPIRIWMSSLGYFVRPAMLFVILVIMIRDYPIVNRILFGIPLMVEAVLLAFNLKFRFMFYFKANADHGNSWQKAGPVIYYLYAVLFFYLAAILITSITNYKVRRSECRIVFVTIGLIIFNYILETGYAYIGPVREMAICLSVITYYMYFLSQTHFDEIQTAELAKERAEHTASEHLLTEVIETLSSTIDAKDRYTHGHSGRVAEYAEMIAKRSGFTPEQCRQIYYAGLLHDIGKIGIPEEIINKPGKLTPEEYEMIKTHPVKGQQTLENMKDMPYLAIGAGYHHERYDGKGYPHGVALKNIPAVGRIIAVADAYDAMTSNRSYRSSLPQDYAREQIVKGSGSQFDPRYARVMVQLIDEDKNFEMREKSPLESNGTAV